MLLEKFTENNYSWIYLFMLCMLVQELMLMFDGGVFNSPGFLSSSTFMDIFISGLKTWWQICGMNGTFPESQVAG